MLQCSTARLRFILSVCLTLGLIALVWGFVLHQKNLPVERLVHDSIGEAGMHERLVPHKALYEVALAGARNGSQVLNITGQMLYEWQPTCEAWLSNHRFNMFYDYVDSPSVRLSSNFSTFESFDGTALNFASQRWNNGVLFEEIRGFSDSGMARYSAPEGLDFDLPQGTFFPAAHTLDVLGQIHSGERLKSATLFDGSDLDGPVAVSSFIGKAVASSYIQNFEEAGEAIDISLLEAPAHYVRLAFFPLEGEQFTADYEMNLVFHENGVVSDIMIEYDDFTVSQKLLALEKIDSRCGVE